MDFREQQRAAREARRRGQDAGVRVVSSQSRQASPIKMPAQPNILPCDFRSSSALGKLVCNCSGAAIVWGCSEPSIVAHNGMCIPEMPKKWMDGPLKRVDGTTSNERYIPWVPKEGEEMRSGGVVLCDHCKMRQSADRLIAPMVWQKPVEWDHELRFIRNQDLTNDTMELVPQLPSNVIGVIGIPVSGMIPAAYLSRMLCVPLYSFDHKEGVVSVGDGRRGRSVSQKDGVYLVIDDTVYSGGEMKKARMAMKKLDLNCVFAAVYTKDPRAVDIYSVYAPGSVILEWNIFNSGNLSGRSVMPECKGGICTDFDGVICEEPPVNDLRQPDQFQWWLANARPQYLPRKVEVPLIVSFRIEPWRAVTEAWMARWGVRTKQLVLHPSESIQARNRTHNVADHKGRTFRDSPCSIMFESDERQARTIADASGKLVIVPSSGKIIKPDRMWRAVVTKKKHAPITVRNLIYHVCPMERSDSWRKNLEQLMQRWHVFNGKKIIACADGPGIHPTSVVYDILPKDCKIVSIHNDVANREQATFPYLLEQVRNTNENEATFYAHSKGIQTKANLTGATRWRNAMYHYLLDDMDHIGECLQTHAAVGTTKITKKKKEWIVPTGKTLPCQWIFAGTFFWFRHDAIFSYPESEIIYDDRYAVEAWLGTFLPVEEGVTVFQPWPDEVGFEPNAYNPNYYGRQFDD